MADPKDGSRRVVLRDEHDGRTGRRSYDLEALLREGDIPLERFVWGG